MISKNLDGWTASSSRREISFVSYSVAIISICDNFDHGHHIYNEPPDGPSDGSSRSTAWAAIIRTSNSLSTPDGFEPSGFEPTTSSSVGDDWYHNFQHPCALPSCRECCNTYFEGISRFLRSILHRLAVGDLTDATFRSHDNMLYARPALDRLIYSKPLDYGRILYDIINKLAQMILERWNHPFTDHCSSHL